MIDSTDCLNQYQTQAGPRVFVHRWVSVAAVAKAIGSAILAAALIVLIGGCISNGQLDVASTYAQAIAAGSGTTCIQRPSRTIICYGLAVGDGSINKDVHTDAYSPDSPQPNSQKNALGEVLDFAASKVNNAVCAVRTIGDVVCWGWQGIVGPYQLPRTVVLVPGLTSARSVSVGSTTVTNGGRLPFGCAVLMDKTVSCWTLGQEVANAPQVVAGLTKVSIVSVGDGHACALREDQSVWCWGDNASGQLGLGDTTSRSTPTQVSGLQARSISAGISHTCAVRMDGAVLCWGPCAYGAIGIPDIGANCNALSPRVVDGASHARSVSAGWDFTCAVMVDDTVRCWGDNKKGQLGIGPSIVKTHIPMVVPNLGAAIFVSAANNHACASSRVLSVRCWGQNTFGQLTDASIQDSFSPVPP